MNYLGDVVPSALEHARTRVALTRDELVEKVNRILKRMGEDLISSGDVDSWESGGRGMTWSEAYAFTKVTMSPFNALFQTQPPPEPLTDYRSPPGGQPRELDYRSHGHLYQFNNFYEMAKELCGRMGVAENINIPVSKGNTANQIATEIRRVLGVDENVQSGWTSDDQAFDEWKRRIEDVGVFVISLPLDIEILRGASRWDNGGPPAILVSTSDLPSAKCFTLLHELAHLANRGTGISLCDPVWDDHLTEKLMNQIAAEALVPAHWVRRETSTSSGRSEFVSWPHSERTRLRGLFNVSRQMLGQRLTELGITTNSGYVHNGWARGNGRFGGSRGKQLKKAERYRRYLGEPLVGLLREGLDRNSVGPGEVLKHWLTDIKWHDLWKVAGNEHA